MIEHKCARQVVLLSVASGTGRWSLTRYNQQCPLSTHNSPLIASSFLLLSAFLLAVQLVTCLSEVMTSTLSPPNLNSSVQKLTVFVTPMAWHSVVYLHFSSIQLSTTVFLINIILLQWLISRTRKTYLV